MASALVSILLTALAVGLVPSETDDDEAVQRLAELSLEDLLEVEVLSVSRKLQPVSRAPAAVYVLNQEDIRRSGHSTIPELLRMVPGVHVARLNGNTWAVAARGFNGRFNNKMLVMIDGRTVFTSLFSGVFWDVQDLRLEDIDRIEVIRGPGGTMWGANAVNGVINIITKSAEDTQGSEISARLEGSLDGIVSGRYGASFKDKGYWRTYFKAFDRDPTDAIGGGEHPDNWNMVRGGFRMDWIENERDSFTLQGDVYDGRVEEIDTVTRRNVGGDDIIRSNFAVGGGNVLGRWKRKYDDDVNLELQAYIDITSRRGELFSDERHTFDLDFQLGFPEGERHSLLCGFGYRVIVSEFRGSPSFDLDQSSRTDQLFSAFIQDDITVVKDVFTVTVGSKFEHNDFTGFEVQPAIRALWMPAEDHTVWGSSSRAIRTPSVVQHDLVHNAAETVGPTTNVLTQLVGNDNLGSDELYAHEIGWRFRATEKLYFDITAFYNDFHAADNFTVQPTIDLGGGQFVVPVSFANARAAEVFGAELEANIDITESWKIRSGISWLDLQFEGDVLGTPIQPRSDDEEPNFIGNLRSYWAPSEVLDVDIGLYGVDDLDDLNVPGYVRLDARLGYHPNDSLELSFGIQNATDSAHVEFDSALIATASEIGRTAFFELTWRP